MIKTLLASASAVALLIGASVATAQTAPSPAAPPRTPPAAATQAPGQIDVQRLIGRNVTNAQNETIGEIESVMIDGTGKVHSAIIGVGGFLGIGERHVAVPWAQLNVSPNSDRVTLDMTRDQLRGAPEFRYSETQRRGSVFPYAADSRATGTMSGSSDARTGVVTPGADAAAGQALSASNLIGLNLHNSAKETIGEVKDIIVGADGKVREVIVGVGGFLGMGERYVAISWDQLRMTRANDSRVQGEVTYTRDQLRELPTWRHERNSWIRG